MSYSAYITCVPCGEKHQLHPDDIPGGWKMRKVRINPTKPEGMEITVSSGNGPEDMKVESRIPVPHLVCDMCNVTIPDGTPAMAITMWNGQEPPQWENEYLGIKA